MQPETALKMLEKILPEEHREIVVALRSLGAAYQALRPEEQRMVLDRILEGFGEGISGLSVESQSDPAVIDACERLDHYIGILYQEEQPTGEVKNE